MHVSDNQKYACGRRQNVCINTQKFKNLDSREITRISLPEIKKSNLHGTSFQPSPKINHMVITRPIEYNECLQKQKNKFEF